MQLPDWFFDPRFLTSLTLGLIGTVSAIITIYKTVKERQIQSLRAKTRLLSRKKEEFVEEVSREMKVKYLLSELAATEDNITHLLARRNKTFEELREIHVQSSLPQEEITELKTLLQARHASISERTGLTMLKEISPVALVLAFGSFLPFGNVFALLILVMEIILRQKRQKEEYERILESLTNFERK